MFFSLALPFFYPVGFYVPLSLFLFKTVADSWIFFTGARFSGKRNSLYFILLAELIYLPYLFAVMIRSIGGRYEWKGRTVHR
jgi:hypothetical protein